MGGTGADHPWMGYFVTFLLSAITLLLGLIVWFSRQMWFEQKETNKGFAATFERIWNHLGLKVSEATCLERFHVHKCNIEALVNDFKRHSHTELPEHSKLFIKE
jgi:hypothetical protein